MSLKTLKTDDTSADSLQLRMQRELLVTDERLGRIATLYAQEERENHPKTHSESCHERVAFAETQLQLSRPLKMK